MRKQGRIFKDGDRIVLDGEPQVMSRVRALFPAASSHGSFGQHTHRPLSFPLTMANAKDLLWVCSRYPMEVDPELQAKLDELERTYDQILLDSETADSNGEWQVSPDSLPLGIPLREHQVKFHNMQRKVKRLLLADKMGLGKTASAISTLVEPESRPAIVVCPPHLCTQWEREVKRFLPGATTHVIRGFKNYDLPVTDVVITSYNRLSPWQDKLIKGNFPYKTLILDEVHELRHTGTEKWHMCKIISTKVQNCVGLSGTPIFNYGDEIFSVVDVISPGSLGRRDDFTKEWSDWGRVREPSVLNAHLKRMGLMLRRNSKEAGFDQSKPLKHVITLDADIATLESIQSVARMLAISVLSGRIGEQSESAREFDVKLRHATGVAKAKPAAEFTKLLLEQGERVVLVGWHRDVYDVWMKELAQYNPVMYTGSETVAQKDAAVKKFVDGIAKVFILSLRSGAGIDGLQDVASHLVFGELDWSPQVMDQVVARLDRPGQKNLVQAFYLTIPDGSDPIVMQVLSVKRSQHEGVIEGKDGEAEVLEGSGGGEQRIRDMAAKYLTSIGEDLPERVEESGTLKDVAEALRRLRVPTSDEEELQRALWETLPGQIPAVKVEREVRVGKRSRLDFLATGPDMKVAIECKATARDRAEVYRQVRKYVAEAGVNAVVLYAPWHGIPSFTVDGTPVVVVDFTKNSV